MEHRVPRNAGIVNDDIDWTERGNDVRQSLLTGVEITDVPFVNRNSGFGLELLRSFIVSAVVGSDPVSSIFQCYGDGVAYAPRAPCNDGNPRHIKSSHFFVVT